MSAEPGPESPSPRADGSGPFHAGPLAGRAWLAALPDELAAQRRVIAGLVDRCEAWPLVTSLLAGCSLGRGAADALSVIDAALGVDDGSHVRAGRDAGQLTRRFPLAMRPRPHAPCGLVLTRRRWPARCRSTRP